jgi:hypothetical protein
MRCLLKNSPKYGKSKEFAFWNEETFFLSFQFYSRFNEQWDWNKEEEEEERVYMYTILFLFCLQEQTQLQVIKSQFF